MTLNYTDEYRKAATNDTKGHKKYRKAATDNTEYRKAATDNTELHG